MANLLLLMGEGKPGMRAVAPLHPSGSATSILKYSDSRIAIYSEIAIMNIIPVREVTAFSAL